jgi:hypothetical protein
MRQRIQGRNQRQFRVEALEGRLALSSLNPLSAAPPLSAVLGVHGESGDHVSTDHPTTGNAIQGLDNHFGF